MSQITLGILGGGQLGSMLSVAAKKLNISSEEDLKENLDKLTKSQRIYVKYIEDLQKTIPRKEAQDWEKTFKYPKIKTHLVGSYRRGKDQMVLRRYIKCFGKLH